MIRKTLLFTLFAAATITAAAQTETKTEKRPDIPGTFVVEFGFNRDLTGPDNFSLDFWGSRTVNIYYQYDIRILNSRFSLVPGIGLSLERFKFKRERTFAFDTEDSLKLLLPSDLNLDIRKSQLITNYLEIPLELKYSSKPEDPARTFKASIGGRLGYLYDSFTKLRYKENGQTVRLKDKRDWNLNNFRYGVSAKIGIGNFSLFGYYNLTNLFESGKGPYLRNEQDDFPTFTAGISLSSF